MEPQNTNPQSPLTPDTQQPVQSKKSKKLWIIVSVVVAILLLPFLIFGVKNSSNGGSGGGTTNALFFEALANASQKTKVHQHTYFKLWDEGASTSSTPDLDQLSLTEFDTASKTFNTINATPDSISEGAEKCLSGTPYRYAVSGTTLQASVDTLNDPNAEEGSYADPNGPYSPCNINNSRNVGKFSDGIIPVGLTSEQSASWMNYVKEREVFSFKDEGMTDYNGKKVRKVSFALNEKLDTSALFYAVRDGDTGKTNGTNINLKNHFANHLSMGLATPTSMTGFYLIDETTKLPVYSNVKSTVPKDKNASNLPSFTQQAEYSYPEQLSITKETKLTLFE